MTPHSTTGIAPCELFMGRHLRVALDLLRPDLESVVAKKQFLQKGNHDGAATLRQFVVGQRLMVRNFREGPKWVPAVVRQKSGPVSYVVQILPTISWRRHVDQMHGCSDSPYWQETVAPLPTDNSSASSEVEKTNEIPVVDAIVEEEERDDEVAADKQDITRAEDEVAADKQERLKTKDKDIILSECIDLQIAMDGNDLFIVDGEECSIIMYVFAHAYFLCLVDGLFELRVFSIIFVTRILVCLNILQR